MVGFKWRTAAGEAVQWLASNEEQWWPSTENDSGELQMENYSNGPLRRTVVGFKWRTLVVGREMQVKN